MVSTAYEQDQKHLPIEAGCDLLDVGGEAPEWVKVL